MRTCLVDRQGREQWKDDDREFPAQIITEAEQPSPPARSYAYMGEFKLLTHSYRRYQEIISDATQ